MSETNLRDILKNTGHTQADLARLVGSRSRASEYLNGQRAVPIGDRRLLMSQWGVSAHTVVMLPLSAGRHAGQGVPAPHPNADEGERK